MPEDALLQTLQLVRRHPWWHARARLAVRILRRHGVAPPATVIDVGCGWGINLEALEANGYQATGLDISRKILERIEKPARQLVQADLNAEFPPLPRPFDALLALDVIEHIDDDRAAVQKMARLLRHQGVAVLSVPARPDLLSDFDRVQCHRRRYLPETLRAALTGSGLELVQLFWWGAWMVPVLRATRGGHRNSSKQTKSYADYLKLPPWPAPLVMQLLYRMEEPWALQGRLRTGTSLVAIAKRAT